MMRGDLLMGAALAMAAATPGQALPAGYKAKADALLAEAYPAGGPGASVVISERGRIVYQGSRGLADIAAKKPVTPDTVFRIGSITKQFSAAVVLQLAAEGKLKLDDPIAKYLPTYPGGSGISVRQLLNHTSGIQSYTGIPGWMAGDKPAKAYSTAQLIAEFKDMPPPSRPGEKWDYNNSGYILVGALIEAVTGNRWSDEVERRIAAPLGLASLDDGIKEAAIPAMATGYTGGDKGAELSKPIHMSVPGAAGALVANAADLAKWGNALHHGKVVPGPYYAEMIAPTKLPDGKVEQYGYGIGPSKLRGVAAVGHSGGIFGFSSDSLYVPSDDLFIVILTNQDRPDVSPGLVMRKLSALAIGKPYPIFTPTPLDAKAAEPFVGTYKFKDMSRVLALVDGKLEYRRPEGATSDLVPVGGNRFQFDGAMTWIELTTDAGGKKLLKINQNGDADDDVGAWAGPVPAEAPEYAVPAAALANYAGIYTSPMGKVVVAAAGPAKLTLKLGGQPALPLRAVAIDEFIVERVGAKVKFVADGGKIIRLEIVQGGRTLPATRD